MWSHRSLGLAITSISIILSLLLILGSKFLSIFMSRDEDYVVNLDSNLFTSSVVNFFELFPISRVKFNSLFVSNNSWRWRFWNLN